MKGGEEQYDAQVHRARGILEQLQFTKSAAETELLIARETVRLETLRAGAAADRVAFLQNRAMNATAWYHMAGLYRDLVRQVTLWATRWGWMAERALEFETSTPVAIVRMDYDRRRLGTEMLVSDLDALQIRLREFRERFRDVPNVIEREFRLSQDFHEQFRVLTSPTAPAEMAPVAEGLRRIQFTTDLYRFDAKVPGRYAFARVLGVEIEIQGDIAAGVVTGHLENSSIRLIGVRRI